MVFLLGRLVPANHCYSRRPSHGLPFLTPRAVSWHSMLRHQPRSLVLVGQHVAGSSWNRYSDQSLSTLLTSMSTIRQTLSV